MSLGRGWMRVSEYELACRMVEGATGEERDPGLSAEELLALMDEEHRSQLMRAARAAIQYFSESITIELVH